MKEHNCFNYYHCIRGYKGYKFYCIILKEEVECDDLCDEFYYEE